MKFTEKMTINSHNDMAVWTAIRFISDFNGNKSNGKLLVGLQEVNIELYEFVLSTMNNPVYICIQDKLKEYPHEIICDVFYSKNDAVEFIKTLLS